MNLEYMKKTVRNVWGWTPTVHYPVKCLESALQYRVFLYYTVDTVYWVEFSTALETVKGWGLSL